ncbi:4'-phosphopantetheinyl transferase gsp-like isoform X2 [Impatiens glandulifera]|uniref:4'-phosphopantetheinyl transferase gsp-like isoform X2 n=1 Tax=Impatiens glandulifera TaxID=253017 RepID=UPI001FB16D37|nr:4'-phosphopantetheinyl transferase gsp-like isoform X2 [Impatiens glandulifera]
MNVVMMGKSNFKMKIRCFDQRFLVSSAPLVPTIQLPSQMETHLWYILPHEVKDKHLLDQYVELLSPSEKENVLSMNGKDLRQRALLARTLVRTTIARYQINSQVCPRSLKFRKNMHGKPEVEWPNGNNQQQLHFNLSHTPTLIACGVTMNSPIGIDVEEKERGIKNDIMAFARRYFSLHEVEFLASIPDPELQRQELIKLWTLKEAYVKAVGKGFSSFPFKTFTIKYAAVCANRSRNITSISKSDKEIIVDSVESSPCTESSNWNFMNLELAGSHYAAICKQNDGKDGVPMKLNVWKTIPFVTDTCVSGTDEVIYI